jgi:uncharacterized protein (TIGR02145 family)
VTFDVTLRIVKRPLEITARSNSKVFDNTPLIEPGYDITNGTTLASTDAASVTVEGEQQLCVGSSDNTVTGVQILHAVDALTPTPRDVTPCYTITKEKGTLAILPITDGFTCPDDVTLTLTEGTYEMTVTTDQTGVATLVPAVSGTSVTNNLNSLNPMSEGTYTVVWTLRDACDSAMTTCSQLITVEYAPCEGVTDYHGHDYEAVRVGYQCWLTENLRWPTGDHHTFNDDPANLDKFGYLYSWYTAVGVTEGNVNATPTTSTADDGSSYVQGICPPGWAVPSQNDVEILDLATGTVSILKDPSTLYWLPGFEGVADGTGFNARGGGLYNAALGRYEDLKTGFHFWESDATPGSNILESACIAYYCDTLLFNKPNVKNDRKSVRCVRKNVLH